MRNIDNIKINETRKKCLEKELLGAGLSDIAADGNTKFVCVDTNKRVQQYDLNKGDILPLEVQEILKRYQELFGIKEKEGYAVV